MTTASNDIVATDPHGLGDASEPLATAAELSARFGVDQEWLRRARRQRLVRYIDQSPGLTPGKGPPDRHLYAVIDVEKQLARDGPRPHPGRRKRNRTIVMPEVIMLRRANGGRP